MLLSVLWQGIFAPKRQVLYNVQHFTSETILLALRLEKELEDRIARVAASRGSNKSSIVREAVIRYLEDQEDAGLAQRACKAGGKAKTIAEVRKALGLER